MKNLLQLFKTSIQTLAIEALKQYKIEYSNQGVSVPSSRLWLELFRHHWLSNGIRQVPPPGSSLALTEELNRIE